MNNKILFTAAILFTICYLLAPTPALAQEASLSLDPPIVQAKIKPGKAIIIGYTVENLGDPTNIQFLIRPFTPVGQLGSLTVNPTLEGPVQFGLENADLELEKPFFSPTKDKKQAVVRISVPPGVPDGDYYYLVMVETVPAFSVTGSTTGVASASIGSPLLISITESGITEIKATIADFSFTPDYVLTIGNNVVRIVDSGKELPVVCSIRNMGKNLIQPQGTFTDQNGQIKNSYSIIPQNILSNSQRVIKVYSDETTGQANSTLTLSHLTVGTHHLTAAISFADSSDLHYQTITFFALPVRLIQLLIAAIIIVLLIFLGRFIKKRNGK